MRSNAGMANRQGDVYLPLAQVSAPSQNFGLAWLHATFRVFTPDDSSAYFLI